MSKYASLLVSDEIQEREVALPNGEKHTLHFREVPVVVFRRFQIAEGSDDDEVRASSIARLIQSSLCEPDGKPALTIEQACKLKPAAASALLDAVLEVSGRKTDPGNA